MAVTDSQACFKNVRGPDYVMVGAPPVQYFVYKCNHNSSRNFSDVPDLQCEDFFFERN